MHQSIYLLTAVKSKLVKTVNLDELTKFAQLCSHKTQKLTKRPPPPQSGGRHCAVQGADNHLQQLGAVWRTVLYLTTVGFVKEYWRYNRSKQVIRGDLTFWIVWGLAHSASFIVCCWTLWTLWLADCRCGAPQGGQTFLRGNLDFMHLLVNLKFFSLHGHCMCYYSLLYAHWGLFVYENESKKT